MCFTQSRVHAIHGVRPSFGCRSCLIGLKKHSLRALSIHQYGGVDMFSFERRPSGREFSVGFLVSLPSASVFAVSTLVALMSERHLMESNFGLE